MKAAAGSYEQIPSEKSIKSDAQGHKSESTDCGSDLLYCLIKINLVRPTVEGWDTQDQIDMPHGIYQILKGHQMPETDAIRMIVIR